MRTWMSSICILLSAIFCHGGEDEVLGPVTFAMDAEKAKTTVKEYYDQNSILKIYDGNGWKDLKDVNVAKDAMKPVFEDTKEMGANVGNALKDSWVCPSCGKAGITTKFCPECGSKKPEAPKGWTCPECGTINRGKFCTECGAKKPENTVSTWDCECGEKNITGKFCPNCGHSLVKTVKCPKCGATCKQGAKFCGECGEKLS